MMRRRAVRTEPFMYLRLFVVPAILASLCACATPPQPALRTEASAPVDCHPTADTTQPQYIVGYGSLMQDESRKRTSPQAGEAFPVDVTGFQRRWIARGDPVGFSTTYLGVTAEPSAQMNAVTYRVDSSELAATDRREISYCRALVPTSQIAPLEKTAQPLGGQAWIYVNKPESIATPSARYPIVQSYVDIFVSGCLEQEQRFGLEGFAQRCLTTTQDWSEHWVNDRIYPRRPFIYQPKSRQIDALLAKTLPQYFARIRIE